MSDVDGAMLNLLLTVYAATKSGNRLEAIESVEIAARHGIKTQYKLRKMKSLTSVCCESIRLHSLSELTGPLQTDL